MDTDEALLGINNEDPENRLPTNEGPPQPTEPNSGAQRSVVTTPNIHYSILLSENTELADTQTTIMESHLQKITKSIIEGTTQSLIAMTKADHHRNNMRTALTTNKCPKGNAIPLPTTP